MTAPFAVTNGKIMLVGDGEDAPVEVKGGISADGFGIVHAFTKGWLWFGYLRDAKGVWWFSGRNNTAKLVSRRADRFRVEDDDYGLDGETLYLEERPVPGSDPGSFALLAGSPYFARDHSRLYVKGGGHFFHFDGVDAASLVANGAYVADRDHLFHHGEALSYANQEKTSATVEYSLEDEHGMLLRDWFLKHHPGLVGWWHPDYDKTSDGAEPVAHTWFRTGNAVFFRETHDDPMRRAPRQVDNLVRGADPARLEVLDADHARDCARVFCRWRTIEGADAASFELLGGLFARDRERVYFNGYAIAGTDPESFVAIPTDKPFGKDKTRVFCQSFARTSWPFGHPDRVFVAADKGDPASFRVFGERGAWAADSSAVYLWGEPKSKLDPASFRFLLETPTNSWAHDKNGLYRANGALNVAGIDGARFARLNDFWGSDGKAVFSFVSGAIQKAADAASFRVTDDQGGAEDRATLYRIDKGTVRKKEK
jgi:hypothetical protein